MWQEVSRRGFGASIPLGAYRRVGDRWWFRGHDGRVFTHAPIVRRNGHFWGFGDVVCPSWCTPGSDGNCYSTIDGSPCDASPTGRSVLCPTGCSPDPNGVCRDSNGNLCDATGPIYPGPPTCGPGEYMDQYGQCKPLGTAPAPTPTPAPTPQPAPTPAPSPSPVAAVPAKSDNTLLWILGAVAVAGGGTWLYLENTKRRGPKLPTHRRSR